MFLVCSILQHATFHELMRHSDFCYTYMLVRMRQLAPRSTFVCASVSFFTGTTRARLSVRLYSKTVLTFLVCANLLASKPVPTGREEPTVTAKNDYDEVNDNDTVHSIVRTHTGANHMCAFVL